MSNKAVPQLIRRLRAEGYVVTQSRGNGHWQVRRGKQLIAVLGLTPGDRRAVANALAQIRRAERQFSQQEGNTA